jgi:hypothetical protein
MHFTDNWIANNGLVLCDFHCRDTFEHIIKTQGNGKYKS